MSIASGGAAVTTARAFGVATVDLSGGCSSVSVDAGIVIDRGFTGSGPGLSELDPRFTAAFFSIHAEWLYDSAPSQETILQGLRIDTFDGSLADPVCMGTLPVGACVPDPGLTVFPLPLMSPPAPGAIGVILTPLIDTFSEFDGDVNGDGKICPEDAQLMDNLVGAQLNDPNYTPRADFDLNGVIETTDSMAFDEVYNAQPDCNANGLPDSCDIGSETSTDCNENGIPDECECSTLECAPPEQDCNLNQVHDACELEGNDINSNGVLDECESIYVDEIAPPAGDGLSWQTAFDDLQMALTTAQNNPDVTIIKVAGGMYTPHLSDRNVSFQMANNVMLQGGFRGAFTVPAGDPEDRDFDAFRSTLSGDLAGDDGPNFFRNTENSLHVVAANGTDTTAVLDGFTIEGGNANLTSHLRDLGGGVQIFTGTATITNCVFRNNMALNSGAGIYVVALGEDPIIVTDCLFQNNEAIIGDGGGLNATSVAEVTLARCDFVENTADTGGGAVVAGKQATITNCRFFRNVGDFGGGLYSAVFPSESAMLVNCVFSGNEAIDGKGGGIAVVTGLMNLVNCTLSRNTAAPDPGGNGGGGLWGFNASSPVNATNTIFWENSVDGIMDEAAQIDTRSSQFTINDSIVQGWTGELGGTGFHADPQFVDSDGPDDIAGTEDDNLRPHTTSLAIDSGDDAAIQATGVTTDLDGGLRIFDADGDGNLHVDLGAYERDDSRIRFVDVNETPGTGLSWASPFSNLYDALGEAELPNAAIDEIWVAAGRYTPDSAAGRDATFELINNVRIYGGFLNGSEFADRDPDLNETVLSGDLAGDDEPGFANNTENSYHVVTADGKDATAVLDGFVIEGGNADLQPHYYGGGIRMIGGYATIANCVIRSNTCLLYGAGIYLSFASDEIATISDCRFENNVTTNGLGGGMYTDNIGHVILTRCDFVENVAAFGGGVTLLSPRGTLTNCRFFKNTASSFAGGLFAIPDNPAPTSLVNCMFSGNEAVNGGGGISMGVGIVDLINCTLSQNTTAQSDGGGGVYVSSGTVNATNTIFWENIADGAMDEKAQLNRFESPSAVISIIDSIVQGWTGALGGTGFHADPQFVDSDGPDNIIGTEDDNLRLQAGSPAIDVGSDAAITATGITVDLDGGPRILDGDGDQTATVDLGAYERDNMP
ncbi:MAG: right-handed parallel beta-helix repeat-containing protein [Phycisphaerales bacterium]|nr:right-handed parallel beta-helix repeat-containing protein [Phycisphaerales bacterium]